MKILGKILVLALPLFASACGETDRLGFDPLFRGDRADRTDDDGEQADGAPVRGKAQKSGKGQASGKGSGQANNGPGSGPDSNLPLETWIDGLESVPAVLSLESLSLRFRSNVEPVTFECRPGDATAFADCTGADSWDFGRLSHGSYYELAVRARSRSGRVDTSPLVISFLVDLQSGARPQVPGPGSGAVRRGFIPGSASELPSVRGARERRDLQTGSYFMVTSPESFTVTSYSTTKTYNSRIHAIRLTGDDTGSTINVGLACDREYERIDAGPDGQDYCDATPTRAQWVEDYPRVMPLNHVEIIRRDGGGPVVEKLLVAAFDGEHDQAEANIGNGTYCQGSGVRGSSEVPALRTWHEPDQDPELMRVMVEWCQVRDTSGAFFWIGTVRVAPPEARGAVRLRMIYTLAASEGVYAGAQFAARAGSRLAELLAPIAALPGTR